MEIQEIEGVFGGFSGGVATSSGANALTKAISMRDVDYMTVDDVRWKNVTVTGSLAEDMAEVIGQKIKIFYMENVVNGTKKRILAGFEGEDGKVTSIMEDDIKPTMKGINTLCNMMIFLACMVWFLVGGVLSVAVGGSTDNGALGAGIFVVGLTLVGWGMSKLKDKKTKGLKKLCEFAIKHDRSV